MNVTLLHCYCYYKGMRIRAVESNGDITLLTGSSEVAVSAHTQYNLA